MRKMGTQRFLRPARSLLMIFLATAGLMTCLAVMHGLQGEHGLSAETVTATAMVSHHEVSSADLLAAPVGAARCDAPCGTSHVMTAVTCAVALLGSVVLVGAARLVATGWPIQRRMQLLVKQLGSLLHPIPPSLLFLSISRT